MHNSHMRTSFILIFTFFVLSSATAQSTATLKAQIEFCRDEIVEKESKIKDYQEVMKKQHGEIVEAKKEINNLKKEITRLNTESDQLRIENSKKDAPAARYYKLAQKFEDRKQYQEAIELYNLIIDTYPHSSVAMNARNTLRSYKNDKGKKK